MEATVSVDPFKQSGTTNFSIVWESESMPPFLESSCMSAKFIKIPASKSIAYNIM